jgi:hypothetical protein
MPHSALLDPREHHDRIASPVPDLSLFLRHLPPTDGPNGRAALYAETRAFLLGKVTG